MKLYKEIDIATLLELDVPVILEIGANNGLTTKEFGQTFQEARLYCFEPDERVIPKFKCNTAQFGNRCKLYEIAITNMDGHVSFRQSSGRSNKKPEGYVHMYSSTIKGVANMLKKHKWIRYSEPIQVPCMRLDTWIKDKDIPKIDFIWADVEGAEEDLILGGFETLKRTHYFYTEYRDDSTYEGQITSDDIIALLPNFELVKKWKIPPSHDMLLHNKNWEKT